MVNGAGCQNNTVSACAGRSGSVHVIWADGMNLCLQLWCRAALILNQKSDCTVSLTKAFIQNTERDTLFCVCLHAPHPPVKLYNQRFYVKSRTFGPHLFVFVNIFSFASSRGYFNSIIPGQIKVMTWPFKCRVGPDHILRFIKTQHSSMSSNKSEENPTIRHQTACLVGEISQQRSNKRGRSLKVHWILYFRCSVATLILTLPTIITSSALRLRLDKTKLIWDHLNWLSGSPGWVWRSDDEVFQPGYISDQDCLISLGRKLQPLHAIGWCTEECER